MTDDVRKLLGGYATGTLSGEEKKALFDAALKDDQLFAALAGEQGLKELLDDGTVRAQLLRATEEPRFTVGGAFREWFEQPKAKALVATGAVLLAVIGFNTVRESQKPVEREVAEILTLSPPIPAPPQAAVEKPLPAPQPQRRAKRAAGPEKERETIPAAPLPAATAQAVLAPPMQEAPAASVTATPFERSAGTGTLPVRYQLLRKEADGEFRPVPAEYEFTEGDLVRIRVTSNRTGNMAVSPIYQGTFAGTLTANQPAVLPETGAITITGKTNKLILSFVPLPDLESARGMSASRFATGELLQTKPADGGSATIEIPIRHRSQ